MRNRIVGILITLGLLAAGFACFQFTDVDLRVQDRLFDFPRQQWIVDRHAPGPRFFFYNGPKAVIIGIGAVLLVAVALPSRWRPNWAKLPWPAYRVWCVIACLVAVPATIGFVKSRSDMYCPWDLDRYGGNQPYHHFFD